MTRDTGDALKELQDLNRDIKQARAQIREIDERLEEVEAPALALEDELSDARDRVKEIRVDERRLELAADEKRARIDKLEERLKGVRNLREEAAVRAELDMVRRGLETDEQEALALLDQIKRVELRIDELEENLEEAREEVEPRKRELLEGREAATEKLERMESRRLSSKDDLSDRERQIFESFQAGGRDVVVAELTGDGACGHCFNMVPLQRRYEIRHGSEMIRCEACGVILTAAGAESGE